MVLLLLLLWVLLYIVRIFHLISFEFWYNKQGCNGGICVSSVKINEMGNITERYVVSRTPELVSVYDNNKIILKHGAQVQIAKEPAIEYHPFIFHEYKLNGKTISYTVDLSSIGCSCNSAFYLVTMPGYGSNGKPIPGDYEQSFYCDSNFVGGVWCWEMDIQEANQYVSATTPHTCNSSPGNYISSCDRRGCGTNSHNVDAGAVCPGECKINTLQPFRYEISFGNTYHVKMTQNGNTFEFDACDSGEYIANMQQALNYGMVLVMSYWGDTYQTMQWLDGNTGCDGDCDKSGQAIFSDIAIY